MRKKIGAYVIVSLLVIWGGGSANGMDSTGTDPFVSTWYGYLNPGEKPTAADAEDYYKSYGEYPTLTEEQARSINIPLKKVTSNRTTYLVGADGRTLYISNKDEEPGKSTCNGGCTKSWPPFAPEAGKPRPVYPLTVITRDDGTKQYAYKGKPLYHYAKDSHQGDMKGEGVGKRWWILKP